MIQAKPSTLGLNPATTIQLLAEEDSVLLPVTTGAPPPEEVVLKEPFIYSVSKS